MKWGYCLMRSITCRRRVDRIVQGATVFPAFNQIVTVYWIALYTLFVSSRVLGGINSLTATLASWRATFIGCLMKFRLAWLRSTISSQGLAREHLRCLLTFWLMRRRHPLAWHLLLRTGPQIRAISIVVTALADAWRNHFSGWEQAGDALQTAITLV